MKRSMTLLAAAALCALLALAAPSEALAAPKKENLGKLTKRFQKALAAGESSIAIEALVKIGELDDEKAAKTLVKIALATVGQDDIHFAARDALTYMKDEKAIGALADILTTPKKYPLDYRVFICEVFNKLASEQETATLALIEAVAKDPELPVRMEAMYALPSKRDRRVVTALVEMLEKLEVEGGLLWEKCRKVLTELTGEDHPTPQAWKAYWEPIKDTFDFDANRGDKTEAQTREKQKLPKFFGSEIMSNRVLFIIDISGSMKMTDPKEPLPSDPEGCKKEHDKHALEQPDPARQRINRAKDELKRVVEGLGEHQRFTIMTFSDATRFWNKGLVPANPKSKASATKWIDGLREGGGTSTDRAFTDAFRMTDIDTIHFLSDGAPMKDPNKVVDQELIDSILGQIKKENRFRKIAISSHGFAGPGVWHTRWGTRPVTIVDPSKPEQAAEFAGFMQRLAAENFGEYKAIE